MVGALLLLLIALGICLCCRKRRRRKEKLAKREETKEAGASLRDNDWNHNNNSHHGFIGAPASRSQVDMAQRHSHEKGPRHNVARVSDEEPQPPSLAEHPAFSRTSDPYTAAGVGAVRGHDTARAGSSEIPKQSLSERRFSDHMPARKAVGTPPSGRSQKKHTNPLTVDTSSAAAGVVAGAVTVAAIDKLPSQRHPRHRYSSGSSQGADPFVSPTSQPPTASSPLSSHPSASNTFLLYEPVPDRRHSQFSFEDGPEHLVQQPPTAANNKGKRPPTPLGFDFGLSNTDQAPHDQARALNTDPEEPVPPVPAVAGPHTTNAHHSGIGLPTLAQRRSLQNRDSHYLDQQDTQPAPAVPERNARRTSQGSFETPLHVPPINDELAVPPRSPKRVAFNQSSETVSTPKDIFRDSGDFVYPSPRSAYSNSPKNSAGGGPALGYRQHNDHDETDSFGRHVGHYQPGRSQGLGQHHSHPYQGAGESGAASSVESWVSARAIPTPWEDNAIRRNSSSGNLRRTSIGQEMNSTGQGKAAKRLTPPSSARQRHSEEYYNGNGHYDESSYHGSGDFDPTWGEGHVEEPIFAKYGVQHSRRRSNSSGFDPRYGRWTSSTFDDEFDDHDDGYGVGKAL